ncbi:MAG: hypothetical protein ABII82_12055, partial [Verrucomicrobiota bacterium]
MPLQTPRLLTLCALVFSLGLASLNAQILSNGTGGGLWNDPATWQGGVVPTTQSWTVLSTDTVTLTSSLSISTAQTATLQGKMDSSANAYDINVGKAKFTLDIQEGGEFSGTGDTRFFTNGTSLNSTAAINMSGGVLSFAGRIHIYNTNTATTERNSFTMSGGTLTVGSGGFRMSGADADDRAFVRIIGNAGTFNAGNLNLGSTADTATDQKYETGTSAGH